MRKVLRNGWIALEQLSVGSQIICWGCYDTHLWKTRDIDVERDLRTQRRSAARLRGQWADSLGKQIIITLWLEIKCKINMLISVYAMVSAVTPGWQVAYF